MAVTALLRESHPLNKPLTALFMSKAPALYKAVIVLQRHTTALLRGPYCTLYEWYFNTRYKLLF